WIHRSEPTDVHLPRADDFENFSLARQTSDASKDELRLMYERTFVNFPEIYKTHPIGATIDKYASRYEVDPALLFFLIYIDSYYGESVSGPIPFLRSMTPETVRDLVQIHLPGWFIEAPPRKYLVSSDIFDRL